MAEEKRETRTVVLKKLIIIYQSFCHEGQVVNADDLGRYIIRRGKQ